jgi:hypothetical protein
MDGAAVPLVHEAVDTSIRNPEVFSTQNNKEKKGGKRNSKRKVVCFRNESMNLIKTIACPAKPKSTQRLI